MRPKVLAQNPEILTKKKGKKKEKEKPFTTAERKYLRASRPTRGSDGKELWGRAAEWIF